MGSSKLIAVVVVLLPALLAFQAPMATAANSNLFRDYIGAIFNGVKFTDVPINPRVRFDFILAFIIDYTTATSPPTPTDGKFNIFWQNAVLTPSAVASIKRSNPNVRVAVSMGGATVNDRPVFFNITSVDSWVSNAVESLTAIVRDNHLDGIDVDYEQFQVDPDTFAECVGRLITTLKSRGVIKFASIAPFDNADVQRHYQALWAKYGAAIDYVNFQFYAYAASTTDAQYVDFFNKQIVNYPGGNILASFTTAATTTSVPIQTALSACRTLQREGKLYGIFIWAADHSRSQGFKYDTEAQALLANATTGYY
ncbi:chitinase 2-like [Oryza brachyantha]|uniref:GH18 domain-containing protein n=1 Tax=Oryza brachyantha TaxID=4533 RepID=J3N2N9_ORYBR|nr:chitinase 2-like [Oryza brachyantha]XP_015697097.1 chitinase 2-like [Oryza brachyantha]